MLKKVALPWLSRFVSASLVGILCYSCGMKLYRSPEVVRSQVFLPTLHTVVGHESRDEFGHNIAGGLDYDQDGILDFAVSAPAGKFGGSITVYSGKTSEAISPVFRISDPRIAGLGVGLAWLPDRDHDGLPEILAGAPEIDGGAAIVIGSSNGAILARFLGKGENYLGQDVCALPDLDQDGFADFAVGAPGKFDAKDPGFVAIVSGHTGQLIRELRGSNRKNDRFGTCLISPGDLDGDGFSDLVVGAVGDSQHGAYTGAVFAFSAKTGKPLYHLTGACRKDELGHDLDSCGDQDQDGVCDFVVAANSKNGNGRGVLVSGKTGQVLREFKAPESKSPYHAFCYCGDFDGDGFGDFAGGAPRAEHLGLSKIGQVYLFCGRTGEVMHTFQGDIEWGELGYRLAYAGDLNDDGRSELLIGYCLTNNPDPGRIVVVSVPAQAF